MKDTEAMEVHEVINCPQLCGCLEHCELNFIQPTANKIRKSYAPAAAVEAIVGWAADKGGEADAIGVCAQVVIDEQRRVVQRECILPCAPHVLTCERQYIRPVADNTSPSTPGVGPLHTCHVYVMLLGSLG